MAWAPCMDVVGEQGGNHQEWGQHDDNRALGCSHIRRGGHMGGARVCTRTHGWVVPSCEGDNQGRRDGQAGCRGSLVWEEDRQARELGDGELVHGVEGELGNGKGWVLLGFQTWRHS